MLKTRRKLISTVFSCTMVLMLALPAWTFSQTDGYSQYDLKAAFLYNFLLFSNFEPEQPKSDDGSIIIGILGKSPFNKNAFERIKDADINGRKIRIKYYKADASIDEMKECRILFIPSGGIRGKVISEKLKSLKEAGVLTVGEQNSFIEKGGMINLDLKGSSVSFEVNTVTAKQAGITFRSKMLRLATRVIKGSKDKDEK